MTIKGISLYILDLSIILFGRKKIKKTNLDKRDLSLLVVAEGFEPSPSEPKSEVLSIKLCDP